MAERAGQRGGGGLANSSQSLDVPCIRWGKRLVQGVWGPASPSPTHGGLRSGTGHYIVSLAFANNGSTETQCCLLAWLVLLALPTARNNPRAQQTYEGPLQRSRSTRDGRSHSAGDACSCRKAHRRCGSPWGGLYYGLKFPLRNGGATRPRVSRFSKDSCVCSLLAFG